MTQMKRFTVIVALKAQHCDAETARFLKFVGSLVIERTRELLTGDLIVAAKCKNACSRFQILSEHVDLYERHGK